MRSWKRGVLNFLFWILLWSQFRNSFVSARCDMLQFVLKYWGIDSEACPEPRPPLIGMLQSSLNAIPQQYEHQFEPQASPSTAFPVYEPSQNLLVSPYGYIQPRIKVYEVIHQQPESREYRIERLTEILGNLVGDIAGVIISEIVRKSGDQIGELTRYIVSRTARFVMKKGGALMVDLGDVVLSSFTKRQAKDSASGIRFLIKHIKPKKI